MSEAETKTLVGRGNSSSYPCDHSLVLHGICFLCGSANMEEENCGLSHVLHAISFLCGSATEERRSGLLFDPFCVVSKIKTLFCSCDHRMAQRGICCQCKRTVARPNGLTFNYIAKGLELSPEFVASVKKQVTRRCIAEKKLYLVLDLDNTLIHTRRVSQLTEAEKHLVKEADSRDDLGLAEEENSSGGLTKLRPFAREFLREANQLFRMSVYTNGNSAYAARVLKLLDPNKIYFGNRVIARSGDSTSMYKTLDLVLAEERSVVIVDDRSAVWSLPDQRNLMQIEKYEFFDEKEEKKKALKMFMKKLKIYTRENFNGIFGADGGDSKSDRADREGEEGREREGGALANTLRSLKRVHEEFFHGGDFADVRVLLRKMTRN
ncbi:PREDICTED: RNA polymerase II C-terminal domain phosphatase-like 4 [Tarenaya hassleriana]|uniref:RNA polymerase II C-terminal domain phosphatase-like 4 n=1 Tax=Tarenaya hassleriana TaxID=28532 RepID=UPI0008FCEA2B|nr:PREDICTED: RNA polymerase II C-terminal domain phosphatase-like 4 [Tarenaya hassleriana]